MAGARERFGHVSIILWLISTAEFWERDEACWGSLRPSSYTAFNGLEDYEVSWDSRAETDSTSSWEELQSHISKARKDL